MRSDDEGSSLNLLKVSNKSFFSLKHLCSCCSSCCCCCCWCRSCCCCCFQSGIINRRWSTGTAVWAEHRKPLSSRFSIFFNFQFFSPSPLLFFNFSFSNIFLLSRGKKESWYENTDDRFFLSLVCVDTLRSSDRCCCCCLKYLPHLEFLLRHFFSGLLSCIFCATNWQRWQTLLM